MADFIVVVVLLMVLGAAILYIKREKKKGVKCIGCPAAAQCAARKLAGNCGGQADKG